MVKRVLVDAGFFIGRQGRWWSPKGSNLVDKIWQIIREPIPKKENFDTLIKIWPSLKHDPSRHHH